MAPFRWAWIRETGSRWIEHNAFRLAASLAFYTLFSLAPLLVIVVGLAGAFFGEEAVRGEVVAELRGLLGEESALVVQKAIADASIRSSGLGATLASTATLLFGATIVVSELQDALNTIWRSRGAESWSAFDLVKKRLLSLALVVVIGFLLLVSLVASAVLNAAGAYLLVHLPAPAFLLEAGNFVVSFAAVTGLFAAVYKVLPDVHIDWGDVWVGALTTAALFMLGKTLIGAYLGQSAIGSTYGAAGSLATILVWVYYSALTVLLGAEFTYVYARRRRPPAPGEERPSNALPER
jgi:membrane protein